MSEKEEYIRKVLKSTIRSTVQTLLNTKEFSKGYLVREDHKEVDKEIDKISDEVTFLLVSKLKERGYLENENDIPENEFEKLLKSTLTEYFGEKVESDSK
jgi:hypothetical protein